MTIIRERLRIVKEKIDYTQKKDLFGLKMERRKGAGIKEANGRLLKGLSL